MISKAHLDKRYARRGRRRTRIPRPHGWRLGKFLLAVLSTLGVVALAWPRRTAIRALFAAQVDDRPTISIVELASPSPGSLQPTPAFTATIVENSASTPMGAAPVKSALVQTGLHADIKNRAIERS